MTIRNAQHRNGGLRRRASTHQFLASQVKWHMKHGLEDFLRHHDGLAALLPLPATLSAGEDDLGAVLLGALMTVCRGSHGRVSLSRRDAMEAESSVPHKIDEEMLHKPAAKFTTEFRTAGPTY